LGDGLKVTGRTQNVMVASTGDTLLVMYTGRLTDGTVFDTNLRGSYTPFPVRLGQGGVIQGWERGLVGAKLGDKFTLHIPAKLAYGAAGSGPVPANADLIFDIEVVGHWRPYRP
jgi:FKBP-type peptidyl-prolyl cis-trans isomerase